MLMCSFDLQKFTITQIQYNINIHQLLVVTFAYTGAARSFIINAFAAHEGQKGWTALY